MWQQARAPQRAVRSRGFGVHSPFAFRFIREVLRQPYAYYCYSEISRAASDTKDERVAKALFRLALFFREERMDVSGPISKAGQLALKLGGYRNPQHDSAICLVGLHCEGIMDVDRSWQSASQGMLFVAPEMAVFVNSTHLPQQKYNILLP